MSAQEREKLEDVYYDLLREYHDEEFFKDPEVLAIVESLSS